MCGIFCGVSCKQCSSPLANQDMFKDFEAALIRRGPDASCLLKLDSVSECATLGFFGSLLWLQGAIPTVQPYQDADGNVLLWNGDVFSGIQMEDGESDTTALGCLLRKAICPQEVLSTLSRIHGPWSFVYWQKKWETLWFGRDVFGRHSLLWSQPFMKKGSFCISSISKREGLSEAISDTVSKFQEVPANGIYSLVLPLTGCCCKSQLNFYPWSHQNLDEVPPEWCIRRDLTFNPPIGNFLNMISPTLAEDLPDDYSRESNNYFEYFTEAYRSEMIHLKECLQKAVEVRLKIKPDLCKDCVKKALFSFEEKGLLMKSAVCDSPNGSNKKELEEYPSLQNNIASPCDSSFQLNCHHSKLCVLFSGGIDSTVLALLADRCIDETEGIDLLNVAFEQNKCKRKEKQNRKSNEEIQITGSTYEVPDRLTGRRALEELRNISPTRKWNFVDINVTQEELEEERRNHISQLIFPQNTVLDDSIACALWFAARGHGTVDGVPYISPARVVLVGMGADEQLCGYSRHRVEFNRGGWDTLSQEIHKEMARISSRNLGRDNRIISDLAREPRLPFLDENVVSFLNSLPSWKKARLDLPRGVGEKLLLRLVANDLGLISTATFHKRAIQFGSRIAKLQTGKMKGSDVSEELEIV